jgi:hypothetical protein
VPTTSDLDGIEGGGGEADTRDLDEVQHVWTLKRTGSGAFQSTAETTLYVHPGDTIRVGWDCNITSILPSGTVLATMSDPECDNDDIDPTKLGIGPNGTKQPMLGKAELEIAADAEADDDGSWVTTQVTNSAGAGPITVYGKVVVLEAP